MSGVYRILSDIRKRHQIRMDAKVEASNEGDGVWRTTKNGHKVFINGEGEVTKGNPKVVAKLQGKEMPKKAKTENPKINVAGKLYTKPSGIKSSFDSIHGVKYPKPAGGAKLDTDTLAEVERLATTENSKGGSVRARSPEDIQKYKNLIASLKSSDYVYMKDPKTGEKVASIPGIAQRIDTVVTGRSEECQKIYDAHIKRGQKITSDMIEVGNALGSRLMGLENCYKGAASTSRKVDTKRDSDKAKAEEMRAHGINPPESLTNKTDEQYISGFGDVVRYTVMSDHKNMVSTVNKTISEMEKRGYKTAEVDNKWTDPNSESYRAVHMTFESPDGEKFEVQVHSSESMEVKEKSHKFYEKARKYPKGSQEYEKNMAESKRCWKEIEPPDGIETLLSRK